MSSLLKSVLNNLDIPYMVVDLRSIENITNPSYRDLVIRLEDSINTTLRRFKRFRDLILDALRFVEGVEVWI